ncbi:MAG: gliding motility-associated C-terminal domain-containing protein [Saprospiraceae bacterium]|nr:gliding motility-associated C-terminal domain-containing protein [Saprospiraceae bacterium]
MKCIYFKLSFILFSFVIYCTSTFAAHTIGGDVIYKCKGLNADKTKVMFEVIFTLYRDSKSGGAQFDNQYNFGLYKGSGNNWTYVRTIENIRITNKKDIDIINQNPCILVPVNVGVEKGIYTFDIELDIIDESYYISYQRCCRNNTILNIVDARNTGAAFTIEITSEAQKTCNNSPTFTNFPPVLICVNRPINFNHSATDTEGDSLVYEFCAPLASGGTDGVSGGNPTSCTGIMPSPKNCIPPYGTVVFDAPNYTFEKPMAGDPSVFINSITGLIGGTPNILGQYVVGVCVKEYRDGKLIGSIRRDFQFNVTTCEVAINADIVAQTKTETDFTVNSCGDYSIYFKNLSTDEKYIKNYYWEFDIKGKKEISFTRNTSVTFPGLGSYKGFMILNKGVQGLSECSDTASIVVNLYPDINVDYSFSYDTCVAGPVFFKDKSVSGAGPIQNWNWDFGEGKSISKDPAFEFENPGKKTVRLIAEDINKCKDTSIYQVNYFPVPSLIIIEPNTFIGCQPANIFFNNLTKPIDNTYTLNWDFGDGLQGHEISPTHMYLDTGKYTVNLELISSIGCKTTKRFKNLITIVPAPFAGFTFAPENPDLYNNTIDFTDTSKDADYYLWQFDTIANSLLQNPSYTFRDTGTYKIKQIVLHKSGCTDTMSVTIPIQPIVKFFMPNAFTPNNDGLNDDFIGIGRFEGIKQYSMTIWNRWGDRIFETVDKEVGWNGQRNNTGELSSPGLYAYQIEYVDSFGMPQLIKGFVL